MLVYPDYSQAIVNGGNFTWGEYALLRMWNTLAIPNKQERDHAIFLFTHIQKLIRTPINKPMDIVSGARTVTYAKYLRSIGIPAALKGAHNSWEGVDLEAPSGMSNAEFWRYCDKVWPGRMELLAYTPTWVHLDTRNWGRRERFKP